MSAVKSIINLCMTVMQYQINLFGYHVSLFAVFVWGLAIFLITWFLFGIFK